MSCGIYKITNKINGKIYIGFSKNLEKRKYYHFYLLKRNIHHNEYLQNSFNKYGPDVFEFKIIEECIPELLIEKEDYWCKLLKTHNINNGYNIEPTGFNSGKSLKTIKNLIKSNKNKRIPILVTFNNITTEYPSILEFCNLFNFRQSSISRCLKKGNLYLDLYEIKYKNKINTKRIDNRFNKYLIEDELGNKVQVNSQQELFQIIKISSRTYSRNKIKIDNNLFKIKNFLIKIERSQKNLSQERTQFNI